jgi:hypothetical protein
LLILAALEWAAEQSIGPSLLEPASGRLEDLGAGLAELVQQDADMQAFQYELALETASRSPARRRAHVQQLHPGDQTRADARRPLASRAAQRGDTQVRRWRAVSYCSLQITEIARIAEWEADIPDRGSPLDTLRRR